jgi:translation elongation factor EF-G
MKVYDAASIRNVALVGHSGSGKTQLASAMLTDAGMVNRFGKVDDGTTVTDYDEEEIARKHTLSASLAYAEWNKHKINLIDTPGMGNFFADATAALHVADAALVVVDAVGGVMVQTEKVWAAAEELALPRVVVVNRLDRERASLERTLTSLHEACNRTVIPIQLPIGEERNFRGVVDLVSRKAFVFQTDESGKFSEGAIPGEMTAAVDAAREALIEMVAENDEKLMEKFFEAGTLSDDEIVTGLRAATIAGKVFPLVCTSATLNIGVQQLLDSVLAYLPSPVDRPMRALDKAGAETVREADEKKPAAAFVWKTIADPFAGRITMFRVASGTLKADSGIHNKTRDTAERFGHLLLLQGKTQSSVPEIKAGDLGAVAKLKDTLTNDTLGDKSDGIAFPAVKFPEPVLAYAIEPKSRGDEDKISTSMHRLEEEDPSIRYSRDPQTKGAAAGRPGTAAHRGHGREAEAPLRRRREPEAAADPVPRDDQGLHGGARPPQETDRRTRAVRRLQDQGRAAGARRRFRVRGRHLRRRHSAAVRAGGRERHSGRADPRLSRRLPDGRFPGDRLRRLVPRRRLERALVQAGRIAGVQGRDDAGTADDPRADHERRGLLAVGLRRRPDGGSQQPPRAASAAWIRAAR